jgi:hypothetical protein
MSSPWPEPSPREIAERDAILRLARRQIREGRPIPFPSQDSPFRGQIAGFEYQFEGEEDLLRLIVRRADGGSLELCDSLRVARFALPGIPETLYFCRPGTREHHYYLAHDLLLETV